MARVPWRVAVFRDKKFGQWPPESRLLYLGLLSEMDSARRVAVDPVILQGRLFPYQPDIDILSVMRPLVESKRLVIYESGAVLQGYLPYWRSTSHAPDPKGPPKQVPREWVSDKPELKEAERTVPLHVQVFLEEYEAALGIVPEITTPDAVALAKVSKLYPTGYREIVQRFVRSNDPWLVDNAHNARFLPGRLNRILLDLKAKHGEAAGAQSGWR